MRISLDTETTGLDLWHGAKPFLVTICDSEGPKAWEWDVDPNTREPKIPNRDKRQIRERIREAQRIYMHNAKFDAKVLDVGGIWRDPWPWEKTVDTQYSAHLLNSKLPSNLTAQTLYWLGVDLNPLEERMSKAVKSARAEAKKLGWRMAQKGLPEMPSAKGTVWKFDMWLLRALVKEGLSDEEDAETVVEYANGDSSATYHLGTVFEKIIADRGLTAIHETRQKLVPIVHRMEDHGITLSRKRLREQERVYQREKEEINERCVEIAAERDYELELPKSGNNKSLSTFAFDVLKMPVVAKTPTGKPALDQDVLDDWLSKLEDSPEQYEFARLLRDYRKRSTALTYLEGYKRFWLRLSYNSRILHPSLNPTGTDTLRWSSSNPNEQNISKKKGFNLRYCFGPRPGRIWISLDYDNLELRIPAYESGEQAMIDIFERPDEPPYFGSYHLLNASIVYPDEFWPIAEQKGEFKKRYASTLYQWIKNFGFAVSYGAMEPSGTADRAAHRPGAQRMVMDKLKEHSRLNQYYIDYAEKHGYVETIPDREVDPERGYPLVCTRTDYGRVLPTVPLNYHVQGTACWVMMRAMIKVQDYLDTLGDGWKMVMNVHDEIVLDFPSSKRYKPKVNKVRKLMESVGEAIGIPLTVGVDYHPNNWAQAV